MATQAKEHYLSSQILETTAPSPVARIIHPFAATGTQVGRIFAAPGPQAKTKANRHVASGPIDGHDAMSIQATQRFVEASFLLLSEGS